MSVDEETGYKAAYEEMEQVRERAGKLLGPEYIGWNWVHALVDKLEKLTFEPQTEREKLVVNAALENAAKTAESWWKLHSTLAAASPAQIADDIRDLKK